MRGMIARRGMLAPLAYLILSGCGLSGPAYAPPAPAAAAIVDMGLTSFSQPTVTIHAGQTVEWRNTSILTHTVSADPAAFDSGNVAAGEIYLHRFDAPGTYR